MNHLVRNIKIELKHHLFDYLLLFTGGLLFLLFLRMFEGYRTLSFMIICIFVGFYIFWGQHHHSHTRHARLHHIVEYVLIGFTVLFLTLLLIQP